MAEEHMDTLVLVDEEDKEHEFQLLNMLEIKDNQYAVLIPLEEAAEESEEATAVVLRVEVDENGEEFLTDIVDEDEFNMVVEALQALDEAE